MTTRSCNCAALQLKIESLLLANKKLLAENKRLRIEVGTFRVLVGQMRELRERELSESEGEDRDDDVIWIDSDNKEQSADDVQVANDIGIVSVNAAFDENDANEVAGEKAADPFISESSDNQDQSNDPDDKERDVGREAVSNRTSKLVSDESDDEVISLDSDDSDDEAEDAQMETAENQQDQVGEAHEAKDDVKEQSIIPEDKLWKQRCTWKCAKCQNVLRGGRYHRLRHLAAHKKFKLRCPLDGCSTRATLENLKYKHLQRHHHISYGKLTKTQKEQLGKEREKCLKKSREFEREFFPRKNFCKVIE